MTDYTIANIDTLEHDTGESTFNSMVQIDSTHYILAYSGTDANGYIKTFSVDAGSDTITELDSLEHDTINGTYNSLVMIDSTHFMLAYRGDDGDGYIKTFSIDGSYVITQIDVLEHETTDCLFNSLVKIDDTHFMLAYRGPDFDGFVKTFSIDGSYDNITQIDVLEHDTDRGSENSLVKVDATHFILAYSGTDLDGFVKTFSIDGSYDNITQIDILEHDTGDGRSNSLIQIDATHYMLAYRGTNLNGFVKTFSIDGSADNIAQIDSLEHDTDDAASNSLVKIDSILYMLAYGGTDGDGFIKTFSIDGSYENITQTGILEYDIVNGSYNSLVKVDATHAILAYTGENNDGFIKTFLISEALLANNALAMCNF